MPYKVLTGLSYPPDKNAEVGDVVNDLPPTSVKWLLDQGHIEALGDTPAPSNNKKDGE